MTTPRASWSTAHPSSATLASLTSAATRTKPAPIYNPYDKFTKPQFDAWIDDITGTLRRALGHIDDDGREHSLVASDESSMGHIDAEQASESSEVDGDIEDSFAELKARRASKKGKARDPREGPGLFSGRGNGSYEEPIDLASDSEDEEAQVEELARVVDDADYGSGWEEQDEREQSEQDAEDVDPETDAEVDYEDEENHEEAGSDMDEGSEAYDEDEDEEQLDVWQTDQSSSPPVQYEVFDADDEDHVEQSDEPEVIELLSDEEISITGSSPLARGESEGHPAADIDEEDGDQSTHEDAAVSPDIYDVDNDDEQPLYNDTAFPSIVSGYPFLHEPVEIMDPWVRPQQYASDLYKGGDHFPEPETHLSPHKLGETDVTSTSITPQRELDEDTMLFELSRHKSPEVVSHLHSPWHASYLQYDPDSIGTTNKEEYYAHRDRYRQTVTSLFSNKDVANRRPDERHLDTDNDVTALKNNLEGPSNDSMGDLPLSAGDVCDEIGENNDHTASPELAVPEKQSHELPAVPFVNPVDEIVFDLYGDLKTEVTVEVTGQPVAGPVLHEDLANVQHSQDVPMSPELALREDHESDPPHLPVEPNLNTEASAAAEPEDHLNPDVATGLTHHQPFESEFPLPEGRSLPPFVTLDISPGSNELQDGHDAEEPAFLPTPPADEPTITSEEISSVLNQLNGIPDDTDACNDSKQQKAKPEPSLVPKAVDHDAMNIHEENPELAGIDIPVIVEPAPVHTGAATDIVVELREDDSGREVVTLAEISSQEVITADNHLTVIKQTQVDDISSVVDEVPTALVDNTSAASNSIVDTDKTPSKESPKVVVDETCAALANDGPADAIDIGSAALPYGSPTLPFEEGLVSEPPLVVAVGDHADVCVDNNRADSSAPTTNGNPAVLGNDGVTAPDEPCSARSVDESPSIPLDTIATGPVDALVPTDEAHTVDADMTVDVLPQPPDDIDVVKTENATDTFPIAVPADIASSPSVSSGSPAPLDPHTPPTQLKIQTDFSPLFTPHTHIKRRPPGLMTTPPTSEGYSSDDVRSPSRRDGEEKQHSPDPEQDRPAGDQITVDFQDAVVGTKPSESTPSRPRRESLTRTPQVVPTTRARAKSVLQPDPYPYSLSTPGVAQYLSKSGSDEVSEDENENDLSNTSSSSNDRELEPSNPDIHDSQNMTEPTVGVHVPSEITGISTNNQALKDNISPTQPIDFPDNATPVGPLSPIEDLADIESSPKRPNGVPSTSLRQIPQVVIKTDVSSVKHHSQKVLNAGSLTVDRNDAQGSTSTKRKRKSSGPTRLTHTSSNKRKGKRKADSNGSPAPSDATSPGGLGTKLLTYSRKSSVSRASSSTPSEASVSTSQVPPTPTRSADALHRPPVHYPPALLHGHSTQSRSVRHRHHLPTAGPSRASSTSSLDRPLYYSSPVTRSNCRYRRISLPKVEGGPRISFLVPGCSLGDTELMEDEEIVDHGDASTEDSHRVVPDIENLDFSPYLIGVLRQLVGVDLLREQEVYYLCAVGEDPRLVQKKKADRFTVNRIGESSNSPRPLSESVRSPSASIRPPLSGASIASTSPGIVVKKEDDGYESPISLSTVESHTEAPAARPTKRQKTSVDTPPPSASTSRTKMKSPMKRSLKPIAYISAPVVSVPEEEDSDVSGDELPFDHRPKAPRAKGLKRARTDVGADEEEDRRFKKLKGRLSDIH